MLELGTVLTKTNSHLLGEESCFPCLKPTIASLRLLLIVFDRLVELFLFIDSMFRLIYSFESYSLRFDL